MQMEQLLTRLEGVRHTQRGYIARCPAHTDHTPSLSLAVGKEVLLVKCWAGCTLKEIVSSIGLCVSDLFYTYSGRMVRVSSDFRKRPRWNWRTIANNLEDHADGLWARAQSVLSIARNLNAAAWTEVELDAAVNAVAQAHFDIGRAKLLADAACRVRQRGLLERSIRNHEL
jgi:hypothetical protein